MFESDFPFPFSNDIDSFAPLNEFPLDSDPSHLQSSSDILLAGSDKETESKDDGTDTEEETILSGAVEKSVTVSTVSDSRKRIFEKMFPGPNTIAAQNFIAEIQKINKPQNKKRKYSYLIASDKSPVPSRMTQEQLEELSEKIYFVNDVLDSVNDSSLISNDKQYSTTGTQTDSPVMPERNKLQFKITSAFTGKERNLFFLNECTKSFEDYKLIQRKNEILKEIESLDKQISGEKEKFNNNSNFESHPTEQFNLIPKKYGLKTWFWEKQNTKFQLLKQKETFVKELNLINYKLKLSVKEIIPTRSAKEFWKNLSY